MKLQRPRNQENGGFSPERRARPRLTEARWRPPVEAGPQRPDVEGNAMKPAEKAAEEPEKSATITSIRR